MKGTLVLKALEHDAAICKGSSLSLVGARVALDAENVVSAAIEIRRGRITAISPGAAPHSKIHPTVDLTGYLLLPGLINAHDHLEFNLFPKLGEGPYNNFEDWANDVYHPDRAPVRDHLKVPKPTRLWWGAIKNLFSGVTTVCHHNAPIPRALAKLFPINVVDRYAWAHSLAFGGDIQRAFDSTRPNFPFIIHLAEGTDQRSSEEIFKLDRLNALQSRTVIVHGVGLDVAGHELLERRGAGLVWCPTSNMFTLGKTLSKEQIEFHRNLALGSDSALTGAGHLLDEIQFARRGADLTPRQIYPLVTSSSARILRLAGGHGSISVGGVANLIAVVDTGESPCRRIADMSARELELVVVGGDAKLLSADAAARWPHPESSGYEVLRVGNVERLIRCPVRKILQETERHLGEEIALAGKRVTS